jgi:hypothetical protein
MPIGAVENCPHCGLVGCGIHLLDCPQTPEIHAARQKWTAPLAPDVVNHPPHYTSHPSGVECITVTEHMGFNLGNAVKYIWRADLKNDALEDLRKAVWYVQREIERREKAR